MNKVALMGRMTKDVELKYTQSNVAVVSFTIAVDRRFVKQGEERQADFINVVAWRHTAEFIAKYFAKGQQIVVCGSLQARSYDDKDGKKQYITEVVAEDVYFAGKRETGQGKASQPEVDEYEDKELELVPSYPDDELPF